jgi:hypothetical protein
MEIFTLAPARWRTVRALGSSPLVRISDRVEAMAVALAVTVALMAAPAAGAVGTAVHDARSRVYAEAAQQRYRATAIVTSTGQTARAPQYAIITTTVHAHWHAKGVEHTGTFRWDRAVATGNLIEIWVDTQGRRVNPPPGPWRAAFDAVFTAVMIWLGVVAAAAALVAVVRWWLDRLHDAAWEREIRSLCGNDGGRTGTQP